MVYGLFKPRYYPPCGSCCWCICCSASKNGWTDGLVFVENVPSLLKFLVKEQREGVLKGNCIARRETEELRMSPSLLLEVNFQSPLRLPLNWVILYGLCPCLVWKDLIVKIRIRESVLRKISATDWQCELGVFLIFGGNM